MADEKLIRQIRALADDDPRRQRYAELLAQAGRMTIPRLHPGDSNSVMSQLATMLDAPVPIVGAMTEHAAAWRACLLEQGLGDLLAGLSKQVLTIFFLLCWRDSALRLAGKQREQIAAASEGLTLERYRAMHPAYREDKEDDNHD